MSAVPMATLKPARRRRQLIAIVAIAIITAGVGGGGILSMGSRNISSPLFTHSSQIVTDLVTVDAGSFEYFEFKVSEEIVNAEVRGSFFSTGSNFDNDVVVSVVPETALQSINDDKGFPAYYFSGKTASGNIKAELPEQGTMYVIVDNRFSDTPKVVDVNIELAY